MAAKSTQIDAVFAPKLAQMGRYAIDAWSVVRGGDYTAAKLCRDMSQITRSAGVFGGVGATSFGRWLEGAKGFEPRTVLKFALYLQALTAEVKPGSDRDKQLGAAYRNFAKTGGTHRIWGDTPQSALVAAYDWLLYGPGVDPPPGVGTGRHDAMEWPSAATILGDDLRVAPGLTMGQMMTTIDALDPERLREFASAAIDRLAEMAQVEGAIEAVEPELPCDPENFLLRMLATPMGLSSPPTASDVEKVAAATKISCTRVQELLCGRDVPTEDEGLLLNAAAGLYPGLINIYFAARPSPVSADLNAPVIGND
jgi:hypothetical protein